MKALYSFTATRIMQEIRATILRRLYDQERKRPYSWIDAFNLAEELNLGKDEIEFHLNYLEEKGFIRYERVLGGGGIVRITALGIDAVENPNMFVNDAPFLQQLIIYGDVVNSTIMQAESIKIRNGLNKIAEQVDDAEIKQLIEELISESYQEKPDAGKIKEIFNKIKQKAPEIAEKIGPIVIKLLERWLNSS